jgi:hypothetical protein
VKIWYVGIIKKDIQPDYMGIDGIHKYAGRKVYVYKSYPRQHDYHGRLFRNTGNYYWIRSCFSSIRKLS